MKHISHKERIERLKKIRGKLESLVQDVMRDFEVVRVTAIEYVQSEARALHFKRRWRSDDE